MLDRLEDTIVAISSPLGTSARGIVRLSGPQAITWCDELFIGHDGRRLPQLAGHRRLIGQVILPDAGSVPAEAYLFRSPASYTRQDIVELHTVGSAALLAMLLEEFTRLGARVAEPGEFTARAFLSGSMDLTRVEGVAAIIHARNDSQLRAAEALLHGRLSQRMHQHREQLADLLAQVEAGIDFADEGIEFVALDTIRTTLAEVAGHLRTLLAQAPAIERLEVLPRVLLAGRPNAGKSTLLNRLTGMDRAIASATAHTTRDLVGAPLALPAGEVMLLDSAGLCMEEQADCEVHALAQQVAHEAMTTADCICWLIECGGSWHDLAQALAGELAGRPVMILAGKSDLMPREQRSAWLAQRPAHFDVLFVSALNGEGLDALREELSTRLLYDVQTHGGDLLALSQRQRDAIQAALQALQRALIQCEHVDQPAPELLALEIREALDALSLLSGELTTEDVLGRIFSRFCIGK